MKNKVKNEVCWEVRCDDGYVSSRYTKRSEAKEEIEIIRGGKRKNPRPRIVRVTVRRGGEAKRVRALIAAANAYRKAVEQIELAGAELCVSVELARKLVDAHSALESAALEES